MLAELKDAAPEERTARFTSAICFVGEDSTPHLFEASCEGTIGYECRGENGFGYDPIFYVGERSFAQLSGEEKDAMSHRGKALRLFAEELPQLLDVYKRQVMSRPPAKRKRRRKNDPGRGSREIGRAHV